MNHSLYGKSSSSTAAPPIAAPAATPATTPRGPPKTPIAPPTTAPAATPAVVVVEVIKMLGYLTRHNHTWQYIFASNTHLLHISPPKV